MGFCKKFRPQLPVDYNLRIRRIAQPIPSLEQPTPPNSIEQPHNEQAHGSSGVEDQGTHVSHNNSATTDASDINENDNEDTSSKYGFDDDSDFIENEDNNSIDEPQQDLPAIVEENAIAYDADPQNVIANEADLQNVITNENTVTEGEAKDMLPAVHLDEADDLALNDLYEDDCEIASTSVEHDTSNLLARIVLQPNETAEIIGDKVIVTKKISNDLQMVYTHGEEPRPLAPLYQTKLNDLVSGNIPFKENVCILHLFALSLDDFNSRFIYRNSKTALI